MSSNKTSLFTGYHTTPRGMSLFLVLIVFWLASLCLHASYTATLTSSLAAKTERLPFSSMREALAKDWIVANHEGTSADYILKVIYPTVIIYLLSRLEICQLDVWNDCIHDFITLCSFVRGTCRTHSPLHPFHQHMYLQTQFSHPTTSLSTSPLQFTATINNIPDNIHNIQILPISSCPPDFRPNFHLFNLHDNNIIIQRSLALTGTLTQEVHLRGQGQERSFRLGLGGAAASPTSTQ